MARNSQTQAEELLQELGLKEYEAKCLVALTRMDHGTAKEISEVTEVPRTRVYDAIRVLEAKGLVDVQYSSPRRYRAASIDEAIALLRRAYESRVETLKDNLEGLPPTEDDQDSPPVGEIWGITNHEAITTRSRRLIDDAEHEAILIVGDPDAVSDEIYDAVRDAIERDVSVIVGVTDGDAEARVRDAIPDAKVFVSDLPWLPRTSEEGARITRLLLVDDRTVLVGSRPAVGEPEEAEQAVVGNGASNGIVVILRKLLRSGFLEGSGNIGH